MCVWGRSIFQRHTYTQIHSRTSVQMVEFSGKYGNTWVFGTLVLRWNPGFTVFMYGIVRLLGVGNSGNLGSSEPWCSALI